MKRNDLKDFLFKVDGEVQVLRLKSKNGKTVNGKNGKNGKNSGQWTVSGRQPQNKARKATVKLHNQHHNCYNKQSTANTFTTIVQ